MGLVGRELRLGARRWTPRSVTAAGRCGRGGRGDGGEGRAGARRETAEAELGGFVGALVLGGVVVGGRRGEGRQIFGGGGVLGRAGLGLPQEWHPVVDPEGRAAGRRALLGQQLGVEFAILLH